MLGLFKKSGTKEIVELLDSIDNFMKRDNKNIHYNTKLNLRNDSKIIYDKLVNFAQELEKKREKELIAHHAAASFLTGIANGNLSDRVDVKSLDLSHHDIGHALNQISEKLYQDFNAMVVVLKEYEKGVYKNSLNEQSMNDGEIKSLIQGINSLKNSTTSMLKDNFIQGIKLKKSSQMLIDNMSNILESSKDQTDILDGASEDISQISQKIAHSNENTNKMQQSSIKVKKSVNQGLEYATKTVTAMQEINNSTNTINEAIDVIDQIAFQTKILSLNAAVEAATAGEAGKGFAVVANEVRNLSSKSADAAKKIKELVESAIRKTNEGKEISDSMIKGYHELSVDIDETIELIEDTTLSVKDQVKTITSLERTIDDLNNNTGNYISIAHKANEVSVSVNEISKIISDSANSKEFDGKERVLENYTEDVY